MLGIMRKYQKSIIIKIVFAVIVLSFIGTIFLVWGKGDGGTGGTGGSIATVDGTPVSYEQYQQAYDRIRSIYQQIYGASLDSEMEKKLGLRTAALDSAINEILVRKAAKKMGIKVQKSDVVNAISQISAFQKNGAFDFELYQQTLRASRMTPDYFEEAQKEEILVQKARQKIKDGVKISDEDLLKEFALRNDKVNLQFVSFAPAQVAAEVKLSDQELQTYLDAHKDEFKTAEEISLSYALTTPEAAPSIAVSSDEAEAFYRKNIDRYQGKGGILPFAEVKDRVTADVRRNRAAAAAYEKAADAANRFGRTGDMAAAASALGVRAVDTPLFTLSTPPAPLAGEPEVIRKAFSLKQGELGGPVETPRGIYLLKVRERKPAEVPALAKIRNIVEQKARAEKARELARKKAEEALARLGKGDAALKPAETGLFTYDMKSVPKIGPSPELIEAAFRLTTASPVPKEPVRVGDSWYAFRLAQHVDVNRDQFPKMKEQLRKEILPKKQDEAVEQWVKDLRAKAKIEINQAALAQ